MSLVTGGEVPCLDALGHVVGDVLAFKVVVDLRIAQTKVCFIGLARSVVEQISGRRFQVQPFRRTQVIENRASLPLGETGERKDVGAAVAKLGEEAGHGLGRVICSDHQQLTVPGDRVLGDHARSRFHIALVEVAHLSAVRECILCLESVDAALDIEGDLVVGSDEAEGELRVVFVGLHRIGQTNSGKFCRDAARPKFFDSELAEAPGERGILPTTDPENETVRERRTHVVLEEVDPAPHLLGWVDDRHHSEVEDDLGLKNTHASNLPVAPALFRPNAYPWLMLLRASRALEITALVVAMLGVAPGGAAADTVNGTDYPSWAQVEAARGNEAATSATIAQINSLLGSLQAEANRLGDLAVKVAADAALARVTLARASTTAANLQTQADAAQGRAQDSRQRAGQIVAAMYRAGGTDLSSMALIGGLGKSTLLYGLGALDKVGAQLGVILTQAKIDRNQSTALADQASVARTARDLLSKAADAAAVAAKSASDAADKAVAEQRANVVQLYAQLAALKNSTAQVEANYRAGQEAEAAYEAQFGASGASGGDGFSVPGSGVNDPASAQSYAFGRLADLGFGGDQNSCLLRLWNQESGWRTNAYNYSSGAYGIPQSLPASKMATAGWDWRTNYQTQIEWGLAYIANRYGSPCGAWSHEIGYNWY